MLVSGIENPRLYQKPLCYSSPLQATHTRSYIIHPKYRHHNLKQYRVPAHLSVLTKNKFNLIEDSHAASHTEVYDRCQGIPAFLTHSTLPIQSHKARKYTAASTTNLPQYIYIYTYIFHIDIIPIYYACKILLLYIGIEAGAIRRI